MNNKHLNKITSFAAAILIAVSAIGAQLPVMAENLTDSATESSTELSSDDTTEVSSESSTDYSEDNASDSDLSQMNIFQTEVEEADGTLTVTAEASSDILPSDSILSVRKIEKGSSGYSSVEETVTRDAEDKGQTLTGFVAYDISFWQDGGATGFERQIEPDGDVHVSLSWGSAVSPDPGENSYDASESGENGSGSASGITSDTAGYANLNSSEVSVLHLEENAAGDVENVVDLTASDSSNISTDSNNAVTSVDLTVDSFSVFTITWTKGGSGSDSDATIGNVSMHYVDVNGLEIDRTDLTNMQLQKSLGNVVSISDWVNNSGSTRKVSGYIFQKATLGQNGTEITGLRVNSGTDDNGKTVYRLYYTTAIDPSSAAEGDWITYTDSVSGNNSNNADIYLYFKSTAQRVNVHYVDEDGNILINPQYKYADRIYNSASTNENQTGINLKETDTAKNTWAEQIQGYEFTGRVHMGETGWKGYAFSVVKAISEGSDNTATGTHTTYRFQYKLKNEDTFWTDLTATDVYLIYRKTSGTKLIKVHYIDRNGNAITDEAGNELTKIIDAGEWTDSTWYNLPGLGDDIDGYEKDADSGSNGGADGHGILTNTDGSNITDSTRFNRIKGTRAIYDSRTFGSVQGKSFRFICYVAEGNNAGIQVGEGSSVSTSTTTVGNYNTSTVNGAWTLSGDFDIYLVYKETTTSNNYTYTVHYVDEDGNEISTADNATTLALTGDNTSLAVTASGLASAKGTINGYEPENTGYLGRATAETGGIPFTSITFTKQKDSEGNETGKWNYKVINGSSEGTEKQLNLQNLNFYVVYKQATALRLHFVDTQGNLISNATIKARYSGSNNSVVSLGIPTSGNGQYSLGYSLNSNSGYTYKEIRVGSFTNPIYTHTVQNGSNPGSEFYILYSDNGTKSAYREGTSGNGTETANLITDVYLVYTKSADTLNIHYVYTGTDNTLSLIDSTVEETNVTPGTKGQVTQLSSGTYVKPFDGKVHIGTRIGPSWKTGLTGADLGPNVSQVYAENGQLYYSFSNAAAEGGTGAYSLTKQGNNDIWIYASSSGRRFTLTKDGNNYTIGDSQHGTFTLNMTGDGTWTATFHGEAETTGYTVTKTTDNSSGTAVDTYTLTLRDYIPNSQTDVYEMYIDDDSSAAKVWIDDDLKYSGYFTVGRNSWLETRMASNYSGNDKITSVYYTWDKIVTGTENADGTGAISTTTSTVERQQNGIHWNLAYNRADRTWLDIEADNGGRNTTDQQTVSYKVTLHYRQGDGDWQEISSEPVAVEYYSQLMNGSFETPEGNQSTTNAAYKAAGGVWQSTGIGNMSASGGSGAADIEIVRTVNESNSSTTKTVNTSRARGYNWYPNNSFAAEDGYQFAELNAETAGALYQDVITHPNQHLNYWFSHRARGASQTSTPEYDTMYLVIMPTKLAMTSGLNGGEIKGQKDIEYFLSSHGGYDSELATSVSQEVTYRDEDNGILVLKVSSNDQFWHNVSVPNGYIAKSGLTRFFFVAGPTSADYDRAVNVLHIDPATREPTMGNFIDAVGFSQELPDPEGFNLVVRKTFSGLDADHILSLVAPSKGDNKYKITISDRHANSSDYKNSSTGAEDNDALNGAVLSFTENAGQSGAKRYTLTAVDSSGNNLLTGSNTGEAIINDDGSVTMTWTFINQALSSSAGQATSEYFNYYAVESNTDVSGYTLTATKEVTNQSSSGTTLKSGEENAALISEGYSGTFNLTNSYKDQSASDQPRIIITKKFYGLTPSGVQELFADGYKLTVTNSEGTSEVLDINTQEMGPNVTMSGPVEDTNHNTTYTWSIAGEKWGAGTYTVSEQNYNTDEYKITQIKIDGSKITAEDQSTPPENNASKSSITVGSTKAASLTYENTATGPASGNLNGTIQNVGEGTNLIIGQYSSNGAIHYVVWTPEPVGANAAQAIVNKINNAASTDSGLGWGTSDSYKAVIGTSGTSGTIGNINFRSSTNGGTISSSIGSFTYDPVAQNVSFAASGDTNTWTKFYSAKVTGLDSADITVENRYNPVVRILKVDADNTSTLLSGAVFNLYKVESGAAKYYMESSSGGSTVYSWDTASLVGKKKTGFTTNSNGQVFLPELEAGTYFLEEVTAPAGYNRLTKPIAFTMSTDYTVTQAATATDGKVDGIEADNPTPDWNHPYYTITVTNKVGYELPETGGSGTWPFIASGFALILIAGAWMSLRYLQSVRLPGTRAGDADNHRRRSSRKWGDQS